MKGALALLYSEMVNYLEAEPLLIHALEIRKKVLGEKTQDYANSLHCLVMLYSDMEDYARAEPLYTQAAEVMSQHLEHTAAALTEQQQLVMGRKCVMYLDNFLSCLLRQSSTGELAAAATLDWKGAVFVRQRAARIAANQPDLAPLFTELQSVTRRWAALIIAPERTPEQITYLAALTERKEQLERELSRKSSAYRQAREKVTPQDLRAALPENTALVDFYEIERGVLVDTSQRGKIGVHFQQADSGARITYVLQQGAAALDGGLKPGDVIAWSDVHFYRDGYTPPSFWECCFLRRASRQRMAGTSWAE